jgi:hypothetical protein
VNLEVDINVSEENIASIFRAEDGSSMFLQVHTVHNPEDQNGQ